MHSQVTDHRAQMRCHQDITVKFIWIYLTLLLLNVTSCQAVFVVLDEFGALPCEVSRCTTVQWSKGYSIQETVAECQNQSCSVKNSFQERFGLTRENYSLLLYSAKYNDQGIYSCTCDNIKNDVILDVIVPIHVSADESGNITLPCYAVSQTNVDDVTWLQYNNSKVLHYIKNGSTNPGEGYEDRVSLREGGFKYGDLSLTITEVQKTDAGLYRCFVHDETTKGYPHAYMLHVNGGNQNPMINSDIEGIITITVFIVLCVIILVLFVLLCWCKMTIELLHQTQMEVTRLHQLMSLM